MRNKLFTFNSDNQGFSLMEIVVTVGLFGIIMVMAFSTYFSLMRNQTEARVRQKLSSQARFVMEVIQTHLKQSAIDYDQYTGAVDSYQDQLFLINQDDAGSVSFYQDTVAVDSVEVMAVKQDANGLLNDLTKAEEVEVLFLKFYIEPMPDQSKKQKRVTVFLNLQSRDDEEVKVKVQTTFSLRDI